ncbi:MAG TPA: carboxyl transferase domain-containing protein [Aquihabitans sp.]|jgi:acetyl-CoA carboxylase carboxyl transferase subunit beta|nr:carboxyl transferase domain-containing protein [Aquihabitans sp.]
MLAPLSEHWDTDLRSGDPLGFPGYLDKLAGLDHESVHTGLADGFVLIEGDFDVIGGSMGLVHGEKVVRAYDRAVEARLPVVLVTRSGGARMQEGMVALVQLARTAAAARRHAAAGLLSVAVHRSPTTGGVLASYGSLADLRVAEAGATVGFAGPRVVEQTTGEAVDDRSHTAETAFAAHLVDAVAGGDELLAWVEGALGTRPTPLRAYRPPTPLRNRPTGDDATPESGAWAEVRAARAMGRPTGIHVAAATTSSWTELGTGTDLALRTALATTTAGDRVVVVAFDRYAAGGRPGPAGYRLAQRGIELAGRLGLPIVAFVDTPGADAAPAAENDGIAGEIARTFAAMAEAPVPTVSVCVGEGGSGGALALASTDRLLLQEHAVFSVIAPEGAAAILERDASRAAEVAERLRLTSSDLDELGIVDAVVPDDPDATAAAVLQALQEADGGAGTGRRERFDAATARWLQAPTAHP